MTHSGIDDDVAALCALYQVPVSLSSVALARKVLDRVTLDRVKAALEHPKRGRRWVNLEKLDSCLDELLALVPEDVGPTRAEPHRWEDGPSGLSAAIDEDPDRWREYCRQQDEARQRVQDEARRKFGGGRRVRCLGVDIERQAA